MLLLPLTACLLSPSAHAARARQELSLDGAWEIVFDHETQGRGLGWARTETFPHDLAREISVPSCWELTEKDYEGVAFYHRTFNTPAEWDRKVIRLHFDAVNFLSEVWLNDTAVGTHEGGFGPFEFRVDDLLEPGGENTLTLRVAGPILLQDKETEGVGRMETPQWRGAITGGIWQPVRLIATGAVYVRDVFIEPKIADNTATFHVELAHTGDHPTTARVEIAIGSADARVASISEPIDLQPGANRQSHALSIPDAGYWSPDDPHLYRAEVNVTCGDTTSDQWTARFGMREFTIRDKRFTLNGAPMYLKATFFEGLYPVGLAYPDSREMAVREIQLAKNAGFNMIRPWRKPPPPMWLDLCDEMGMLTVGSLAVECMDFPVESARLPGWVENEVRESILRDRNRTCVVQWELFNELKRPVLIRMLGPMSILARELDPTRLILDESGGWAQGANSYLPYESEPTKFNDVHAYPGPQINEATYDKLLHTGGKTHEEMRAMGLRGRLPGKNVVPELMTLFSELGYGSLPDLEASNQRFAEVGNPIAPPTIYHRRLADQHTQALRESGVDTVYPSVKSFCLAQQQIHGLANKRMIEAVRCNPDVKGYCVHALTGGDWVIGAGLLDLFRNPKTYAYEGTKAANQPRILPIRVRPRNVYAEDGATIEITGVNEGDVVSGDLKVDVVAESGAVVFTKTVQIDLASGIAPLFSEKLDTKALEGTHTVRAEIVDGDGTRVAENEYEFDAFTAEQLAVPEERIAVLDPGNALKPFLETTGIAFEEFSTATDRSLPVFVSRTEANTPEERDAFAALEEFIKAGGTAVYLHAAGRQTPWGNPQDASRLLPTDLRVKQAVGLWTGISHVVRDHPVFDGLPVDCMMGPVYENVWAEGTLLDVDGETIVGVIGYDYCPDFGLEKRHYYGPGDTWWGSDLAIVPIGEGRCIVSQLRLVENLGSDPVADKILYNLIDAASGH